MEKYISFRMTGVSLEKSAKYKAAVSYALSFYLPDGQQTVRQVTDAQGVVILTRRYTPWGELLEQTGSGEAAWDYLGGALDAATGRFLSRGVNPGAPNPYVPWQGNPAGMIVGLLALVRGRRKRGKFDRFLVLLIVVFAVSLTVSGCDGGDDRNTTPQPPSTPPSTPTSPKPTQSDGNGTSTPTPPPAQTPTSTPNCPQIGDLIGSFIMSAYYIPTEAQYKNNGGAKVSIPAVKERSKDLAGDENIKMFLSLTHKYDWEFNTDNHRKAIWGFLHDEDGLREQGTGKLENGEYISCTVPRGTPLEDYRFDWQLDEKVKTLETAVTKFETIAVCDGVISKNTEIVIPELEDYLKKYDADTALAVKDTGEALCKSVSGEKYDTLDLFVGEGEDGLDAYYELIRAFPKTKPVSVYYRK